MNNESDRSDFDYEMKFPNWIIPSSLILQPLQPTNKVTWFHFIKMDSKEYVRFNDKFFKETLFEMDFEKPMIPLFSMQKYNSSGLLQK